MRITALLDPPISFEANPPSRDVYEKCLHAAGFSEITWVPPAVSAEGIRAYGKEFWDDFTATLPR
ncbi:hypothetical protein [Streptomyces sp. NBC_01185]|uniref:hypothetical protein n=1 Tax=Streptomyces sp. NBC_01185 TaxID=2903764 RepID=UPI00386E2196